MTQTTTEYEQAARTRKALALLDACRDAFGGKGLTAADVEAFTDGQWALLEQIAGTRPASTLTRALVVDALAYAEGRPPVDDDFDGLGR